MTSEVIDIVGRPAPKGTGRHGGKSYNDRLDGIEHELDELGEGVTAVAEAIDAANAAVLEHIADLAAQMVVRLDRIADVLIEVQAIALRLDIIESAVQGQALVLGQAVPPLVDATQLVGEAQRVGIRKAWRHRRRLARKG